LEGVWHKGGTLNNSEEGKGRAQCRGEKMAIPSQNGMGSTEGSMIERVKGGQRGDSSSLEEKELSTDGYNYSKRRVPAET